MIFSSTTFQILPGISDMKIPSGDFNAKLGTEHIFRQLGTNINRKLVKIVVVQ
jgi:hypothetical protein